MLDLLRASRVTQKITLTPEFKRDLRWFATFLQHYNGVSLYDHRLIDIEFELNTCLTRLGGRCGNCVYHLPIEKGYMSWTIVHLEMINVLLVLRLFHNQWSSKKVLIHCDNQAVVHGSGKMRDPFLAACARNVWYVTAVNDIDARFSHIRGIDNTVADILSRWQGTPQQVQISYEKVNNPVWLVVSKQLLEIDSMLEHSMYIYVYVPRAGASLLNASDS